MGRLSALIERATARGLDRLDRRAERQYIAALGVAAPLGSEADYLQRWEAVRTRSYPAIDAYEQDCGAAIDARWFQQLALLTQVTIKQSALCYQHGRVVYSTLRRYLREQAADHLNIVETGTARGFSSLCMARALADAGAHGKIFTFDVLPHDAAILWNCVRDASGPTTRRALLADYADLLERFVVFHQGDTRLTLRKASFPRVHLAFFDSVHTHDHLTAEYEAVRGRQAPGDIAIFDDYAGYPGVKEAADEICRRDGYSGVTLVAEGRRGYLVARKQ